MIKRCKHRNLMTKPDYPDDIICEDCQTIFHVSDYMNWTAKDLTNKAPPFIRRAVLERQAEQFAKDNPDYYKGELPE